MTTLTLPPTELQKLSCLPTTGADGSKACVTVSCQRCVRLEHHYPLARCQRRRRSQKYSSITKQKCDCRQPQETAEHGLIERRMILYRPLSCVITLSGWALIEEFRSRAVVYITAEPILEVGGGGGSTLCADFYFYRCSSDSVIDRAATDFYYICLKWALWAYSEFLSECVDIGKTSKMMRCVLTMKLN